MPAFSGPNTDGDWPYWRVWLSKREIPDDWGLYDILDANEALDIADDMSEWRHRHPPAPT